MKETGTKLSLDDDPVISSYRDISGIDVRKVRHAGLTHCVWVDVACI